MTRRESRNLYTAVLDCGLAHLCCIRSKAVADGALIWHCVSSVVSRAPRSSYGIEIMIPLVPGVKDHRGRPIVKWPSATLVKGAWSQIVTKVSFFSKGRSIVVGSSYSLFRELRSTVTQLAVDHTTENILQQTPKLRV